MDGDSCFTATNGAPICTDTSSRFIAGITCSAGNGTANVTKSTGDNLSEYDLVPVTSGGCNISGTTEPFASCTLANSSEQGCEFKSVGDTEVDRDSSTGDLTFSTDSATLCLDLSSGPPFNYTGTANVTITGGTGNNTGATGTGTGSFHGQVLTSDPAGHGIGWGESTSNVTITTK
jgi:hypothetical protein